MDEIEISGKRYISTRRAGKEHGYHSDYIGQLIRGGKVSGTKVGRAWYIEEVSLLDYLGKEGANRPVAPKVAEEKIVEKPQEKIQDVVVEVVETKVEEAPALPVEEKVEQHDVKEEVTTQEIEEPVVEETLIPVTVSVPEPIQEISPEEEEHPIPIRSQVEAPKGLRYLDDNEPLLPPVTSAPVTSRLVVPPAQISTRQRKAPVAMVLVAGVIVFLFSIVASAYVTTDISVGAQNAANTYYSIGR